MILRNFKAAKKNGRQGMKKQSSRSRFKGTNLIESREFAFNQKKRVSRPEERPGFSGVASLVPSEEIQLPLRKILWPK